MVIPLLTWLFTVSTTQILSLAVVGVVAAYYLYSSRHYGLFKQNGIPGPTPKPFVGNFLEMSNIVHQSDSRLLERYGGDMVGYHKGPWPVLLLANPDMLRHVMVKDFANFPDRRVIIDGGPLRTGLTTIRGEQWKRIRSVITPTFSSGKLRKLLPLLQHCVNTATSDLTQMAGEPVECKAYFGNYALDVVGAAFFGLDLHVLNEQNSPYTSHAKRLLSIRIRSPMFIAGMLFPFLTPLLAKLGLYACSMASINFFLRTVETAIQKRQHEVDGKLADDRKRDFLDILLASTRDEEPMLQQGDNALTAGGDSGIFVTQVTDHSQNSVTGTKIDHAESSRGGSGKHNNNHLSNEEIMAQAVLFLLAAYDTTSTTIAFFLNALATHPKEQERLRDEINAAYGADDSNLTYEKLNNMLPYLDQCVQETLRVWPAATRTERVCIRDTDVEGVHIPAEVVVAIPIYYLHHNEKYWPEPEQWKPDRFAPEARDDIVPFTYLPFGQGPRNCVGMRFALLQMKVLLAALIQQFRMLPVEGKTEANPILEENAGLLKPKMVCGCDLLKYNVILLLGVSSSVQSIAVARGV